ncbi:MAG: DMT family transporter [Polyangiaceae bacterium]|nr:DMT family transporter [Polyangiaceae bacterium]
MLIAAASAMLAPGAPSVGVGGALVALACIAWGLDNNLTATVDRFTPEEVVFAKGVVAGSMNLVLALMFGDALSSVRAFVLGMGLGALSYGLSLVLYVGGAQQLGATRSQLVFSTAPAWGLVLSWLWLGEPITAPQVGAFVIMSFAMVLWTSERHSHVHTHERLTHTHLHRHDDGHHDHAHESAGPLGWHTHEHTHEPRTHSHSHRPDLHHRHDHRSSE